MHVIFDFFSSFYNWFFQHWTLKPTRILFWSSRTLKWFLFCCFLFSCTSYVMGRMLRWDHTNFQKLAVKRLENEMSGRKNPSFDGLTYTNTSIFHFDKFFKKISWSVPLWNFGNSLLMYTFWKLKKVELVKYDFYKAQIVHIAIIEPYFLANESIFGADWCQWIPI